MDERLDQTSPSSSTHGHGTGMFEQKEFDEQETEAVAHAAIGIVLEREGFRQSDIAAAGIQLVGQRALTKDLANTICRVADQLEADANFQRGVDMLAVKNERGAYDTFAQVSWNVVFHSGGITWARVAGLLVFAGKLAAKVLKTVVTRVGQLISSWICKFIKDYVWRWITDSGGWVRKTSQGAVLLIYGSLVQNGMGEDQEIQHQSRGSKTRMVLGVGTVFLAGVLVGWVFCS